LALADVEVEICAELCYDEDDSTRLLNAFRLTHTRLGEAQTQIPFLVEAYQILSYWYALVKDEKRRRSNGEKTKLQFYEDYLEAAVKGCNRQIIASLGMLKGERFSGA